MKDRERPAVESDQPPIHESVTDGQRRAALSSELASVRRLGLLADHVSDPVAIYGALAGELLTVIGGDEMIVYHLDPAAPSELSVLYLHGGDGRLTHFVPRRERAAGVERVASSGQPLLAATPEDVAAAVPQVAATRDVRSALLLAVSVQRVVEAVVMLVRGPQRPSFQGDDLELAGALVDQAAMTLALVRARTEAGVDPVTGSMNHRALRRCLHEEINRAARTGAPLACLVIDLDDFKAVNDRLGHQVGDEVLRTVARTLTNEFRAFDRVARYGGDEFVVVLPNADLHSAARAAERALERLKEATRIEDATLGSASIGVAEWQPSMDAESLVAAGDSALLSSKRLGKGRVTTAAPRHPARPGP